MGSHPPSSADRRGSERPGAGNGHGHGYGHGKAERTPGTPRRDGAGKDKAVQDPGLKDYVGLDPPWDVKALAYTYTEVGGVFGERCFWLRLQGL